jgi:hypothetical protein
MPRYTFLHNLPNVLVQMANNMGLQKKCLLLLHTDKLLGNDPGNIKIYDHDRSVTAHCKQQQTKCLFCDVRDNVTGRNIW